MQTLWASLAVFGLLIIFHELGHFIVAKLVGIKIHEFSIGFGFKLAGVVRGETAYNFRVLPLGGFVRMAGMEPEEKIEDEAQAFNKKTVFQRMMVISAGPLMNFLLAVLLLVVVFMFDGLPLPTTTVEGLLPGGPAIDAGLQPGDRVVAVNGQQVNQWGKMSAIINAHPDQVLELTIERAGRQQEVHVLTMRDEHGQGKIGIYPVNRVQRLDLFSALFKGAEYTGRVTVLIVQFIGLMITGQSPLDLGGPVRIVSEIKKAAGFGIFSLLQLAAFLSINLGLFNLFPIPALDGSRIMFLVVERLRGQPVDPVKENFIHLIGFGLLMLFFVFITYNDVLQLFQK
ncbi:MAG TPA: RIP metalloprotease RseP [Desulfotomaculum sp.]|jgi:regulator of sigma E protease|nr:RIP metalloprotease RseP [Desulfotomaculum sp.]